MPLQHIEDGAWYSGLDSISFQLGQGFYQWAQNVTNRGGMIGTRQGLAQITGRLGETENPRGICLFSPFYFGVNPYIVVAIGNKVYTLAWPYNGSLVELPNVSFPTSSRYVHFEVCVQAEKTDADGNVVVLPSPRFVLMMQDGVTSPAYWFFSYPSFQSGHTNPDATKTSTPPWNTPVGTLHKWAGDRLWVANGNKLKASDLLNPLQFEEQRIEASGGFFFLPGTATGIGVTHDFKSLLVMTDQTTSAFQIGIESREQWPLTQDFQRVIFPAIGCASPRSIINQYGMTWWVSHDGVVALDTSLQTYLTSKMHVKDHNMSRSKESVDWRNGGGCAGSFGNWLMFSVPSGSKYNVHTWVLDQAVQQDLNTIAPPAWCSNWTGIRPEQWVTGTINGVQRCFCLSHDLVVGGHQATIWEAFIGQKMDAPKDGLTPQANRVAKDIGCAFETKFMGIGKYSKFRYAELDLAEIIGNVHLQVYYCGRRTSYKKVLDKKLTATVSGSIETVFDPDDLINVFVPQYRTVRTDTDGHDSTDANTEIQTPFLRGIDREFSLLVTWTGQMNITGLRICVDDPPVDSNEGIAEQDEITTRAITAEGTGFITGVPVPPNQLVFAFNSKYLAPLKPRWVEFPSYDAAVPNGVFFVDIPVFNPPAGAYPLNVYNPFLAVSLTTEAVGDTIVFTTDGTNPTLEPLHGQIYTAPFHLTANNIPDLVKARGFRTGMIPSVIAAGTYSQAQVSPVVFYPAPGSYPSFPVMVTMGSGTTGATIRYVVSASPTAHVTPSSPVYSAPVSVGSNLYLKAKAFKSQYLDSVETGGLYAQIPQCATPVFNPPGGVYPIANYPASIGVTTATAGAQIRWSRNNPDVQHSGFVPPSGHVTVYANDVLRAVAQKASMLDSVVKVATYSVPQEIVAEPHLHPPGGDFENSPVPVRFNCATEGATMGYNIGTPSDPPADPTPASHQFTAHDGNTIQLTIGHKIIKTIAFKSGATNSTINEVEFDHVHGG